MSNHTSAEIALQINGLRVVQGGLGTLAHSSLGTNRFTCEKAR
jgi:hypothetical protein